MFVIVPNPDNERGVRCVDGRNGELVATGHLVVQDGGVRPEPGSQWSAGVLFVASEVH